MNAMKNKGMTMTVSLSGHKSLSQLGIGDGSVVYTSIVQKKQPQPTKSLPITVNAKKKRMPQQKEKEKSHNEKAKVRKARKPWRKEPKPKAGIPIYDIKQRNTTNRYIQRTCLVYSRRPAASPS